MSWGVEDLVNERLCHFCPGERPRGRGTRRQADKGTSRQGDKGIADF
ncbi:hypothetical protein PI95_031915 [Hassallia byssoidea VB512170]|uniref:Uncharacterized protein n=1 Tax=Hassallia byssoidea VB512170 TaxID=1304833 RepID=A0A846HI10_9CYAN|nr:hypothetical protein [Hassalia byssoidea]NEU76982.1 hypothetical protein [Hassalia byssoidea VB512170]